MNKMQNSLSILIESLRLGMIDGLDYPIILLSTYRWGLNELIEYNVFQIEEV